MMRQVTAYRTEDGKVFDSEVEAAEHELRQAGVIGGDHA